jgi:TetR/AcrR family transcriptional repressor of nem operon
MTGRPRSFDTAEVLGLAMELFWRKGYEATGLSELTEHMGIGRQSLYGTYGDKKQLFLKALECYLDTGHAELEKLFAEATSPRAALEAWLNLMVLGLCSAQDGTHGCFALNSIVELCPDHEDVRQLTELHFLRQIGLVTEQVLAGQECGEFRKDKEAEDLAVFLMTAGGGLIVASKLMMPDSKGPMTARFLLECLCS